MFHYRSVRMQSECAKRRNAKRSSPTWTAWHTKFAIVGLLCLCCMVLDPYLSEPKLNRRLVGETSDAEIFQKGGTARFRPESRYAEEFNPTNPFVGLEIKQVDGNWVKLEVPNNEKRETELSNKWIAKRELELTLAAAPQRDYVNDMTEEELQSYLNTIKNVHKHEKAADMMKKLKIQNDKAKAAAASDVDKYFPLRQKAFSALTRKLKLLKPREDCLKGIRELKGKDREIFFQKRKKELKRERAQAKERKRIELMELNIMKREKQRAIIQSNEKTIYEMIDFLLTENRDGSLATGQVKDELAFFEIPANLDLLDLMGNKIIFKYWLSSEDSNRTGRLEGEDVTDICIEMFKKMFMEKSGIAQDYFSNWKHALKFYMILHKQRSNFYVIKHERPVGDQVIPKFQGTQHEPSGFYTTNITKPGEFCQYRACQGMGFTKYVYEMNGNTQRILSVVSEDSRQPRIPHLKRTKKNFGMFGGWNKWKREVTSPTGKISCQSSPEQYTVIMHSAPN